MKLELPRVNQTWKLLNFIDKITHYDNHYINGKNLEGGLSLTVQISETYKFMTNNSKWKRVL